MFGIFFMLIGGDTMSKLLVGLVALLAVLIQTGIELFIISVFVYGICLVFSIAFTFNMVLGIWLALEAVRTLIGMLK